MPKTKLLFIDDDPIVLNICKEFFTKKGFTTITINSGLTALAVLETMAKLPDLIVNDARAQRNRVIKNIKRKSKIQNNTCYCLV